LVRKRKKEKKPNHPSNPQMKAKVKRNKKIKPSKLLLKKELFQTNRKINIFCKPCLQLITSTK